MWFKQKIKYEEDQYQARSLERTLNRLYTCRDLEISNLWQRSVFLSVFLILCFTGYGYIILKIVDNADQNALPLLNLIAIILASVSLLFSCIWIMMAKGSKAWYEVYESAITSFEKEKEYQKILRIPEDYRMGNLDLSHDKINNNIFSTKAGGYSVSRINIAIGQICFCIWAAAILFHLVWNLIASVQNACDGQHTHLIPILIFTIVIPSITFTIIGFLLGAKKWVKSSHL